MNDLAGPTLTTLTSGALGSLIAVSGAVGVTWWTLRRDRRVRAADLAAAKTASDLVRRQNVAVASRAVWRALVSEVRWAPFAQGRVAVALIDLVAVVVADVGTDHPALIRWSTRQLELANTLHRHWRRRLWQFWRVKTSARERGEHIGRMVAVTALWASGALSDDWMDSDDGSTPIPVQPASPPGDNAGITLHGAR